MWVRSSRTPLCADSVPKVRNCSVIIFPPQDDPTDDRRPPIFVDSITLPRSPVRLSSGDEVPHIFTRKSRLQPGKILITSAKDFCNTICQNRTHAVQQATRLRFGLFEQCRRHIDVERLSSSEINHQLQLGRKLDRQIGRLLASKSRST